MDTIKNLQKRFHDIDGLESLQGETASNLAGRGSCRHFQSKGVSLQLVRTLCALSLCSPSKSDLQQRDIVIIDAPLQHGQIAGLFAEDSWVRRAPRLLVFCGNNQRQRQFHEWRGHPFENDHLDAFFNASVDAAIALSSFVLVAESNGLGCCPVSEIRNYASKVSEILDLPDFVFPVAGLALGWPGEQPPISMRLPLATTVHVDRFDREGAREKIEDYDHRRADAQPYKNQRDVKRFGTVSEYGWLEDKARQYARAERANFGDFVCSKGFRLV